MNQTPEEQRKIIIDEDWKSQVEAERKQQQQQQSGTAQPGTPQPEAGQAQGQASELPEPSFPMLVTTLATQAMVALGQIPDPIENKPVFRPEMAKFQIDMLAVLQEKTKGNLAAEEAEMIEDVVHQLRMVYVTLVKQASGTPPA